MRLDHLMRKPAITCQTTDTLSQAAQRMWEHDCGVLPVVDDDGRLVSVITDRDICMAAFTQGLPLGSIPVTTAMAKSVFSCKPSDALEAAERLMRDQQIRRVPIVDAENRPLGVLSLNDIARYVTTIGKADHAREDALRTWAAVCEPRRLMPSA